ncbi:MAG: PEP/pyruvate-binding domain-containing protein [Acidimicrobiia bacterium]
MISRSPARGKATPTPVGLVASPFVVDLDDPARATIDVVGRKAAALASACARGLPAPDGFVLLPHDPRMREDIVRPAWRRLSDEGARPLVVRSSSSSEDGETSSMAGRFTSVVDVRGWGAFLDAVEAVVASADDADRMSVLVQPLVDCAFGGVLFGVDPVTGRRDRIVVAATTGGPDRLVSGAVSGGRVVLTHRGRVTDADDETTVGEGGDRFPTLRQRSALVRLARRVEAAFGGPQDVEWAFDRDGRLWLLQSRPITAAAGSPDELTGPRFGPGPVAETFPDPLAPLEVDLWVAPLRRALSLALDLSGAASRRRIDSSPVVVSVAGRVAADLDLIEGGGRRRGLGRIDPRPRLRRLGAAWRVGRLRAALPGLAGDLVARVDAELSGVPPLCDLPDELLLRLLRRSQEGLVALHAQEMLTGLAPADPHETGGATAAMAGLRRLVTARVDGLPDTEITLHYPEVLAVTAPAVRPATPLPALTTRSLAAVDAGPLGPREALRLRIRWVHECMALAAWELACRLAQRGMIHALDAVRTLTLDEVETAILTGVLPVDLASRRLPSAGAPLPAAFRLSATGTVVPVASAAAGGGRPAGGGRGIGPVHNGEGTPAPGDVLVVRNLDPRLAVHLPLLAGLVAETGSVLSHLAIVARELGIPTVVGVGDALARFPEGTVLLVDGDTGECSPQGHDR